MGLEQCLNRCSFEINMKKLLSIVVLIGTLFSSAIYAQTRIALISQVKGASASTDIAIQKYLQSKGYQVEVLDQSVSPNSLKNTDLVIISSTVASKTFNLVGVNFPSNHDMGKRLP